MKKYIGLIAALALFVTLQAPSDAKPDNHGPNQGHKPPIHKEHHKPQPPKHHRPHVGIHYNYSSPCYAHYRYNCYDCYHRPTHRHHRGFFGSGLGFTIFL